MKVSDINPQEILVDAVLEVLLLTKKPISEERLLAETGFKHRQLKRTISYAKDIGYDIKSILLNGKTFYTLARYADVTQEDYYRTQGTVSTPFIHTGDWHLGSKQFSEQALRRLIDGVDKEKIKDVLICGDIVQGLGVYRNEAADLIDFNIDAQVSRAIDWIKEFPSRCRIHLVMGNHEERVKTNYKMGFDPCYAIAAKTNSSYYGHVAKLELDKKYNLLMTHGYGKPGYASSYQLERFWDRLIEKPDIMLAGHMHRALFIPKPPKHVILQCGTLQRESSWVMSMGYTTDMSWNVVRGYSPENISFECKRPRVY